MAATLKRKGKDLAAAVQDEAAGLAEAARDQAREVSGAGESHFWSNLGWLLLGAGLGALGSYMLDPDRGRRRQALVRDQVVHARTVIQREVPKKMRYAQDRLQGVQNALGGRTDGPAGGDGPESPGWERAHNDGGSLTGPTT